MGSHNVRAQVSTITSPQRSRLRDGANFTIDNFDSTLTLTRLVDDAQQQHQRRNTSIVEATTCAQNTDALLHCQLLQRQQAGGCNQPAVQVRKVLDRKFNSIQRSSIK